jgi:hypothetical protein
MRKDKLARKKLAFSKETVRSLSDQSLKSANGAMSPLTFGACPTANCMTLGTACPTHDCTLTFGAACPTACCLTFVSCA